MKIIFDFSAFLTLTSLFCIWLFYDRHSALLGMLFLLCVTYVYRILFKSKLTWNAFGLSQLTLLLITFNRAFSFKFQRQFRLQQAWVKWEQNATATSHYVNSTSRSMSAIRSGSIDIVFIVHESLITSASDFKSLSGMKFLNVNRHVNREPRSWREWESQSFKFSIKILRITQLDLTLLARQHELRCRLP